MDEDRRVKVYSPDITPYKFEGNSLIFGTILSFVVAPIRLLSRVMRNVFILPADMRESYAKSLLIVSGILGVIGIVDLMIYGKWPLVASQIFTFLYALRLKGQAALSKQRAQEKREVNIDTGQIEDMCSAIYDTLDNIIKE